MVTSSRNQLFYKSTPNYSPQCLFNVNLVILIPLTMMHVTDYVEEGSLCMAIYPEN